MCLTSVAVGRRSRNQQLSISELSVSQQDDTPDDFLRTVNDIDLHNLENQQGGDGISTGANGRALVRRQEFELGGMQNSFAISREQLALRNRMTDDYNDVDTASAEFIYSIEQIDYLDLNLISAIGTRCTNFADSLRVKIKSFKGFLSKICSSIEIRNLFKLFTRTEMESETGNFETTSSNYSTWWTETIGELYSVNEEGKVCQQKIKRTLSEHFRLIRVVNLVNVLANLILVYKLQSYLTPLIWPYVCYLIRDVPIEESSTSSIRVDFLTKSVTMLMLFETVINLLSKFSWKYLGQSIKIKQNPSKCIRYSLTSSSIIKILWSATIVGLLTRPSYLLEPTFVCTLLVNQPPASCLILFVCLHKCLIQLTKQVQFLRRVSYCLKKLSTTEQPASLQSHEQDSEVNQEVNNQSCLNCWPLEVCDSENTCKLNQYNPLFMWNKRLNLQLTIFWLLMQLDQVKPNWSFRSVTTLISLIGSFLVMHQHLERHLSVREQSRLQNRVS